MRNIKTAHLFLALLVALLAWPAGSVFSYNNVSLSWKTIKTEHFEVHYHKGAEWTAQQVAKVAEEVHGPLTELYGYEPNTPVHFIIKDTDDYANGAAYFYDNKVEIWATNLEFGYRGTTEWIRNVVTHEYAHIISIQAAMKMTTRVPAIYFQLIHFEKERRPDVLQGYPDHIVSYPFSGIVYPPWFAEGVSQYQTPNLKYDCWDSHRDMILRCAVLEDQMLTYDEMGFFGKSSMRGEQVYDHGFGLTNYIVATYGPNSIAEITRALRAPNRLNMDGALKKVTGKKGKELYDDWKAHLKSRFETQTADVRERFRKGSLLVGGDSKESYLNVAPVFSPDGRKIAFLSNKGTDYAVTSLYVIDRFGKNRKRIKGGLSSPPQFSADGKKLLYSRKHKVDHYGSTVNDVFVYDLETKKEKRLTKGARIGDPDFSPDGKKIVGVRNNDGTHRIVVMDAYGENLRELYSGKMGTQFYNPHFSPDGEKILFGIFREGTRDVAMILADGTDFRYILQTPNDERDVRWTRDGRGIIFACDRTGIFNIYELALEDGSIKKHTNVVGGAFMPDQSPGDGALAYSHYSGDGHCVYFVEGDAGPVETMDSITFKTRDVKPYDECAFLKNPVTANSNVEDGSTAVSPSWLSHDSGRAENGEGAESRFVGDSVSNGAPSTAQRPSDSPGGDGELPSSNYKWNFTTFQLFPRIVVWDNKFRLGLFMMSNEILDKQSLFAGGSYGTDEEFDLYFTYEIRDFYPKFLTENVDFFFPALFVDFIRLREFHSDRTFDEETGSEFVFDTQYDLWQASFGLKFELSERYSPTRLHEISAHWQPSEYRVHLEGDEFKYGEYRGSFKGGWKYYEGNEGIFRWTYRGIAPAVDTDINPRGGRQIMFEYLKSWNKLFITGEFEYGFKAKLSEVPYHRFTVDWREYIGLPYLRHSLRLRLFGSFIDRSVDDFFWTYLGGRDGIRGYTYYSIGDKKGALGSLTYRFPVWRNIDKQFLNLYFRDLYAGIFYETAIAWGQRDFAARNFKNSVGVDLRLSLGSFYLFPTAVNWVAAYSLDPVKISLTGFGALPLDIRQERGWSHYLTLAFGFDL
ncbi:MAG: PD40 domain-containing protein [Candidatus Latescibacterota bacterium]|nr:MAG: PD40 domain-containing protein [Candidatus Latescibacterota bacterium]